MQGPPNLASTVARFSSQGTRRRYDPPTLTSEKLLADPEPTDTAASVHHFPATGETVAQLPEGTETTNVREGHTVSDFRGPDEDTGARADSFIDRAGKEYQIVLVGPRAVGPLGEETSRRIVMVQVKARSWP